MVERSSHDVHSCVYILVTEELLWAALEYYLGTQRVLRGSMLLVRDYVTSPRLSCPV